MIAPSKLFTASSALVITLWMMVGPFLESGSACTSFVQETPQGTVLGATLDLQVPAEGAVVVNRRGIAKENFRKSTEGKTMKWVSRYGSISFNVAGRGFPFGGMNEAGLVISSMQDMQSEYPEPDGRFPFDAGSFIQYLLDTCGSVNDVIRANERIRPEADNGRPNHYLVADESGNVAALEYVDGELMVYQNEKLPVAAMSNMPYSRAVYAYQNDGPRWWWSNPGRSAERVAIAAKRIASYDPKRDPNPMKYAFHTLSLVANPDTQWQVGYNIQKRKIWFRTNRSRTGKYFSFSDFDFSCDAPSLLLDVHTAAAGHVAGAFSPYNHQRNLWMFETMCARLDIHVPHQDAVNLMRAVEQFSCAQ